MSKKKKSPTNSGLIKKAIFPLTENQAIALDSESHMILSGSAGTGKTFLALNKALQGLEDKIFERVIIIRSAVATRDIGFLKGNEAEKCAVYELPYKQIVCELFGRGDAYEIMKAHKVLEFASTSYIRGITLDKTCVVLDEAQNLTLHELDTVITRLGPGSRFILCGDYTQADLPKNGLKQFLNILLRMKSKIDYINFTSLDIVRDEFVKDYIMTKERLDDEKSSYK